MIKTAIKYGKKDPPFGGRANDRLNAVVQMQDGRLITVGVTESKSEQANKKDIWVICLHPAYKINPNSSSSLLVNTVQLKDEDNNILDEGEQSYLLLEVKNEGKEAAYDIDLNIDEITRAANIDFKKHFKVGHIPAGGSKTISIPIKGEKGLELKDVALGFGLADASRTRTQPKKFQFATQPLDVPSNFLKVKKIYPKLENKTDSTIVVKEETTTIKVIAKSDQPLKRKHFTIFINGQPYQKGSKAGETGLRAKAKNKNLFTYTFTGEIKLGLGVNEVEVRVKNASKEESTGVFKIEYTNKPNIHIVALGIGHDDLDFTTNDAKDFANSFKNQEGKLFDKIYLTTLISGENTKSGLIQTDGAVIKKVFNDLEDKYNYTIYKNDLLLVFISSHGRNINNAI